MTEVVIDGVRYVPATEAVVGLADVLRALALQYHTEDSLADYGTGGLRIVVGEGFDEGETFDEFAARLAQALGDSRWQLLKDDDRFGLRKGDVLIGRPYWLDPEKITVDYRECDGRDPMCNQYRTDLKWLGPVAPLGRAGDDLHEQSDAPSP
jgi:hypothetical protein